MENDEIDQATVDVLKTILESKNGKEWFAEYLQKNLTIHINSYHEQIHISFHGKTISVASLRIESKLR